MIFQRISALFMLISIIFSLPSCGRAELSPREIVDTLAENEPSLPSGQTYFFEAREGSEQFLSPELLSATYGISADFDGLISAAIRLSYFGLPCEFAVFYCKSRSCAEDIALFCRKRIDSLIQNASASSAFSGIPTAEYLERLSTASVTVSGRFAVLIISRDLEAAKKLLYRLI